MTPKDKDRENKRYQVFSIREVVEKNEKKSIWVKAGSAWINRDSSINIYLDVLPLDGKLHVREAIDERRASNDNRATNSSSSEQTQSNEAFSTQHAGGH